jgi:hypothetical protein
MLICAKSFMFMVSGMHCMLIQKLYWYLLYREGDSQANQQGGGAQQFFLQFITRYMHWSGELRTRVSTITRRWVEPGNVPELITGKFLGVLHRPVLASNCFTWGKDGCHASCGSMESHLDFTWMLL